MVGEMCTLVNRTSSPLVVTQNGRQITLKPGDNPITTDWIRFAKQQHPRMGTFDPSGIDGDYLVGVKGVDDCSMIEPGTEHKGIDRFDRTQMDEDAASAELVRTGITPPKRRIPNEMSAIPSNAEFTGRDN